MGDHLAMEGTRECSVAVIAVVMLLWCMECACSARLQCE